MATKSSASTASWTRRALPEVVRRQVAEAEEVCDPLQAVADASERFPADTLILAVHTPEVANWQERRLTEEVCARFGLPVTEIFVDCGGRVAAVSAE